MTLYGITALGRIGALRVISRQSVMRYKDSKKPLPEIARELNVDAIVEGTVQVEDQRLRAHLHPLGRVGALGDVRAFFRRLR
mgnify:CR=1 FL=1